MNGEEIIDRDAGDSANKEPGTEPGVSKQTVNEVSEKECQHIGNIDASSVNVEPESKDSTTANTSLAAATTSSADNDSCEKEQTCEQTLMDTDQSNVVATPPEPIPIKIIYNKKKYEHIADLNSTILDLKQDIEKLTGVPVATQKVMFKGSTQNDQTLKQLKVSKSSNKFMVIGSTMNDLLKVAAAPDPKSASSLADNTAAVSSKEPLCKQTAHKKVLDKHGKPEDIASGIKGSSVPLPPTPLSGMYNKYGGKTRLTFKLDQDELWIGTKERTQKIKMGSIKDVVSQPIEGHEEYHLLGLQLGPTEASKYWIYWVPAQYINAIKDTILGKWGSL